MKSRIFVQLGDSPASAKPEAVRPPAAKTPEMTVPLPNAKTVKATPSVAVKQAPDEARGRTPTKGKEPAFGSAIADKSSRLAKLV